jgi:hypothetical protein
VQTVDLRFQFPVKDPARNRESDPRLQEISRKRRVEHTKGIKKKRYRDI